MLKKFAFGASMLLLASPLFVSAATLAELQAQLQALLQQIAALQSPQSAPPGFSSLPPTGQCPSIFRALRAGLSGPDIADLQRFLAADYTIYPEASVTGFFGPLTERAVQRFQAREGIVSGGTPDSTGYGAVGPATRAAIARRCGGSSLPIVGDRCWNGTGYMPNGASLTMYSTQSPSSGRSCSSYAQTRTCVNGVLSGNSAYQYARCGGDECRLDGEWYDEGDSETFYSKERVPFGESCSAYAQERRCSGGEFSGSSQYAYANCTAATTRTCTLDGVTVANGASRNFFTTETVAFGSACADHRLLRKCTNGILSGDDEFQYAACTVGDADSCTLDGVTVKHGQQVTFHTVDSVAFGSTCPAGKVRTCRNGNLDGDTTYNQRCFVRPAGSCSLDEKTVAHGEAYRFYSATSVAYGQNCNSISQVRTCTNGTLSGSSTFNRATCTTASANAPTCTLSTAKAVYLPNEPVTFTWTTSNAVSGTLLDVAIPAASLKEGSRASAVRYSSVGDRTVTLSLQGNQSTRGDCSTTVRVQNIVPPTCILEARRVGATTYAKSVTLNSHNDLQLRWSSTGATDYATSSSNSVRSATTSVGVSGGTRIVAYPRETSFTYEFNNAGGSTQCSVSIAYNASPLTVSSPAGGIPRRGDDLRISWQYPSAPAGTWVYLVLTDESGQQKGAFIKAQLNATNSYVWKIPDQLGSYTVANGEYRIRVVAYTPKGACTDAGCAGATVLARAESAAFTISGTASLPQSQLAAALAAIEAILRSMLDAITR